MGITALYKLESAEYELVFKQYYEGLCRYANLILKDTDASEEVVQQTFVKLWEKRANLSIDTSLKSYLYKSVYNASLNELKHQAVKVKYMNMQTSEEKSSEMQNIAQVKELEEKIEGAMLNA